MGRGREGEDALALAQDVGEEAVVGDDLRRFVSQLGLRRGRKGARGGRTSRTALRCSSLPANEALA